MAAFKPQTRPSKSVRHHILVELTPELYNDVKCAAGGNGLSMKEFVRQAIKYTLENIER